MKSESNIYMMASRLVKAALPMEPYDAVAPAEAPCRQAAALLDRIPEAYQTGDSLLLKALALQLGPEDPSEEKPMEEILKLLEQAVEMNPNSAEFHFELGTFLAVCLLDSQRALEHLSRAKELCENLLREINDARDGLVSGFAADRRP